MAALPYSGEGEESAKTERANGDADAVPQAWGVSRDGSYEVYATTGFGGARSFRPEWCVPTWKDSQRPQSGAYGCGELLGRRTGDRVTTLNGRRTGCDAAYGQDGGAPFDQIGYDARIREDEIVEET